MRYSAWRCLQNNFEIRKFRTEIYTERRTAHTYIYTYIHIEKISIDITSVGLASARPNHYSHHKLAFQNTMRAGDQKLMIDLEWPYDQLMIHTCMHR